MANELTRRELEAAVRRLGDDEFEHDEVASDVRLLLAAARLLLDQRSASDEEVRLVTGLGSLPLDLYTSRVWRRAERRLLALREE